MINTYIRIVTMIQQNTFPYHHLTQSTIYGGLLKQNYHFNLTPAELPP